MSLSLSQCALFLILSIIVNTCFVWYLILGFRHIAAMVLFGGSLLSPSISHATLCTYVKAITVQHIAHYESFRAKPYQDHVVKIKYLIGYGQTHKGDLNEVIDEPTARYMLEQEVLALHIVMSERYPWYDDLCDMRKLAILDLAYNIGPNWGNKFPSVVRYMEEGNYEEACDTLLMLGDTTKTRYYSQVGQRAVVVAEAIRYGTPDDISTTTLPQLFNVSYPTPKQSLIRSIFNEYTFWTTRISWAES